MIMVGQNSMQSYYEDILKNGSKALPRGLETIGLVDQSFWFHPGEVYLRDNINVAIGFVELLQFISGSFSIAPFEMVAPRARLDLFTLQSAYGPRVVDQLPRAIEDLKGDQYSRRSVIMIAHPTDTPETLPCTLSMQFQIQEDPQKSTFTLSTIATMRSSDLVWGLPTDIIQFGGIALMVANCVGAIPGECVVNAGNAHVYTQTKLKYTDRYFLGGHFRLPMFYKFDEYKSWAEAALLKIASGHQKTREIFQFQKHNLVRIAI